MAFRVSPLGNVPLVTLKVGAGKPTADTVNVPGWPIVKAVLLPLVMVMIDSLVRLKVTGTAPGTEAVMT